MGRKGINTHELANHHFGRRLLLVPGIENPIKHHKNQQLKIWQKKFCQVFAKSVSPSTIATTHTTSGRVSSLTTPTRTTRTNHSTHNRQHN